MGFIFELLWVSDHKKGTPSGTPGRLRWFCYCVRELWGPSFKSPSSGDVLLELSRTGVSIWEILDSHGRSVRRELRKMLAMKQHNPTSGSFWEAFESHKTRQGKVLVNNRAFFFTKLVSCIRSFYGHDKIPSTSDILIQGAGVLWKSSSESSGKGISSSSPGMSSQNQRSFAHFLTMEITPVSTQIDCQRSLKVVTHR